MEWYSATNITHEMFCWGANFQYHSLTLNSPPPPKKKSYLNNLNFEISERNFSLNACSSVTEHITTITIIPPFLVFSSIAVLWATRVPALIYVQQIYIFKWFSTNVTYNYRFIFLRKTPSQSIKPKEMNFFLL